MRENESLAFVAGVILGGLVSGLIAGTSTKNHYEREAVASNCGHYVVNQAGAVVFTWKKEKTDE